MTKKQIINYVTSVAEEYGVDFSTALAIFNILGPPEMYDGFLEIMGILERRQFQTGKLTLNAMK